VNILCLSDLHINCNDSYKKIRRQINDIIAKDGRNIDAIAITGDIIESDNTLRKAMRNMNIHINPYAMLNTLADCPIICCLGNHEFANSNPSSIIQSFKDMYNPKLYNVHYLDIIGHYDFNDKVRFIGNCLWYDGSLINAAEPHKVDILNILGQVHFWFDQTIINFDPRSLNKQCVEDIKNNIDNDKINILLSHCVPDRRMNLFSLEEPAGVYNTFSGMDHLLEDIKVQYSLCGHTHRRIIGKNINDCNCINVGSDYKRIEYYILEI